MEDCTADISAKMMSNTNDSCIREETIKLANTDLVNHHSQLTLSSVQARNIISSDGQRFIISASSLLGHSIQDIVAIM